MASRPSQQTSWLVWACALAVLASLVLLAVRAVSAISFQEPLMTVTSGAEEEGILGVLRAMEGKVYTDPFKIPFVASYYNWLFYDFFASLGSVVLAWFKLDLAWLPTVGRFIGLGGVLAGFVFSLLALRTFDRQASGISRAYAPLVAAYLAVGPLTGFWALSINPEVWATALAIASAWVMMAAYDKAPLRSVLIASLLSLLSWSFKQSFVFPAGALGLFLLLRRDWRGLAWAAGLHVGGVGLTLGLASPDYRAMLFIQAGVPFAGWQLAKNLAQLPLKAAPFLVSAVLAVLFLRLRHFRSTPALFTVCGIAASSLAIPMSAKVGAAENYYFLLVFYLAALGAHVFTCLEAEGWPRLGRAGLTLGWLAEAAACLAVLAGLAGVTSVASTHHLHVRQKECVADLPSPMFSQMPYPSLPWMHAQGPAFVISYNYYMDRAAGRTFEGGGVGGLINSGWFASLAMPTGTSSFDGGEIGRHYRLARFDCAGLDIYLRVEAAQ